MSKTEGRSRHEKDEDAKCGAISKSPELLNKLVEEDLSYRIASTLLR